MSSRAFVTGAPGFIGQRLVKLLLEEGWDVRALVGPQETRSLPPAVEAVRGDITDRESLRGTMEDIDATFHLAALLDPQVRDPRKIVQVTVQGTDHVIEEALRASVWRFVFTGSLAGMGVRRGKVVREDSPPGRAFGPQGEAEAVTEQHVATAVRERGLPAVTVIPSLVVGPGEIQNLGKFLLSYVRGEYPGTFAETSPLPLVGIDDVARAHLLAYERGRVGERYLISARNTTWGEFMRFASNASGTPRPSRHIGARALWLASRTSEMISFVTRAPPRLPTWLVDYTLMGAKVDNRKSLRELGMTYRPVSESIHAAIDWFREEGLLEPARPPHRALRIPVENPPIDMPKEQRADRAATRGNEPPSARRPKPPGKSD